MVIIYYHFGVFKEVRQEQNIFEYKRSVYVTAVVALMLIFSFIDKSYASANTAEPFFSNTCVIDRYRYDTQQTDQIASGALNKSIKKTIFTLPLFGISLMPQGFSFMTILLLF
jgi:hypothetical protein